MSLEFKLNPRAPHRLPNKPEPLIKYFWEAHPLALFSTKQIAMVLGISRQKLEQMRFKKLGPKYTKIFGSIRYSKRDIMDYFEIVE